MNAPLLFHRPGQLAIFGFELDEGQEEITAFVFDLLAFEQLVSKVPYPFTHDAAGENLSCAQSSVFCVWGRVLQYHIPTPPL